MFFQNVKFIGGNQLIIKIDQSSTTIKHYSIVID